MSPNILDHGDTEFPQTFLNCALTIVAENLLIGDGPATIGAERPTKPVALFQTILGSLIVLIN